MDHMDFKELTNTIGFRQWGGYLSGRPYVIVEDLKTGEFTASTKVKDKTIYILDYGEGAPTLEEAKEAVLKYHKKVLS
jgi:hypothetical protein